MNQRKDAPTARLTVGDLVTTSEIATYLWDNEWIRINATIRPTDVATVVALRGDATAVILFHERIGNCSCQFLRRIIDV